MKASNNKKREGSALLTTLAVTALTVTYGAVVVATTSQQLHTTSRQAASIKARALAEAGANAAYHILSEDFAAKDDPSRFPYTELGGGSYDASVTTVSANSVQVHSVGTYGNAQEVVIVDVANAAPPAGEVDATSPWGHSIFVNGRITHNGSGSLEGSVHCNNDLRANGNIDWDADVQCVQKFRVNGGGSVLSGTVRSPIISGSGASGIANPIIESVATIAFPQLDLTPYYNIAVANGEVYPGGTYTLETLGAIPGGVAWFNGDVTFVGVEFEGCIIATGNITFSGGVEQTPVGMLPAIVSRDGDIRFNGSRDIEGLIYCAGDLRFNGSGTLNGSAVVGGDLTFNGSYGVITYRHSEPGSADDTPAAVMDMVSIKAWQK